MKKQISCILILTVVTLLPFFTRAQGMTEVEKKFSITGSADASMFQIALLDLNGKSEVSTLRYTLFFNGGFDFNYKVNDQVTVFSGLAVKNLGVIRKANGVTNKYRTYNLGLPLGVKIGNTNKKYFIVGGGVDFPFHYKAKTWVNGRKNKDKKSEWFSNQVNPIQPFGMLGYRFGNSIKVKAHYYPGNFWNQDVVGNVAANLIVLTLGLDIRRGGIRAVEFKPRNDQ